MNIAYRNTFLVLLLFMLISSCREKPSAKENLVQESAPVERVVIGAERLFEAEFFPLIKNKKIGLLTNHTGLLPDGRHIIDVLFDHPDVDLKVLFGPEHGLRGEQDTHVADGVDQKTGLPIISLYGNQRKPSAEMLKDIDVLVFDVQDVGARFYTYIKTMLWLQEAAAENNLPFLVLDRPNPIGGKYVDGPIAPIADNGEIPIVHGMTVGELALLFNSYRKDEGLIPAQLRVIAMNNYNRGLWYDQTGLPWIKPSPNMLSLDVATVYPATCLLEGSNLSEGRGTMEPFIQFGAPWIEASRLADFLNEYELAGVHFVPVLFTPGSVVDGIKIYPPKFLDQDCYGVRMELVDREGFASARTGIYIFEALRTLYPEYFELRKDRFDKLLGTSEVRKKLESGMSAREIVASWDAEVDQFRKRREPHLLYK